MTDMPDPTPQQPPTSQATDERPLPWDHWSKERRQWTALGIAAGVLVLGAVVGLLSLRWQGAWS